LIHNPTKPFHHGKKLDKVFGNSMLGSKVSAHMSFYQLKFPQIRPKKFYSENRNLGIVNWLNHEA